MSDRPRCEHCLNRRAFIARAVAAATIVAGVDACGDGVFGPPLPAGGDDRGARTIRVSDFPALATTGTLVNVGGERAVMRLSASTFFAMSLVCTHQGCESNVSANVVICPCHGSRFDSQGRVLAGPATTPLATFATAYDAQTDQLTIG